MREREREREGERKWDGTKEKKGRINCPERQEGKTGGNDKIMGAWVPYHVARFAFVYQMMSLLLVNKGTHTYTE